MNDAGPPLDSVNREGFRDRLARVWRRFKLPVIVVLTVVALVLGMSGFAAYAAATGTHWSSLEMLYRTLMLFAVQGGEVADSSQMNAPLEAARFLAPALTVYAAFLAVVSLFSEQWARLKVRLWFHDHVIICGLGAIGFRLACRCRAAELRVVVIERDAGNIRIALARRRGVIALTGDARDPDTLKDAGISRARHVIVVCGNDSANVEAAMAIRRAAPAASGEVLTCFIQLGDTRTCELLAERELRHPERERVRVHFFNAWQRAARALVRERPVFDHDPARASAGAPPHVFIVGMGRMGSSFVGELARLWHRRHGDEPGSRLPVTVLDPAASERIAAIRARQPSLDRLCEFTAMDLEITSAEGEHGDYLSGDPAEPSTPRFTHVFVFLPDDAASVSAALVLQHQLRRRFGARGEAVPVVVRTRDQAGFGELLMEKEGALALLQPFGFLEHVCDPGLLTASVNEMLARAFHRDFLLSEADARRIDPGRPRKPTDRPWEQLDDETREANRARADAVEAQLNELGLGLRPRLDWTAPYFEFTPEEVEQLSPHEHARWCDERRRHGWHHEGPRRDDPHKLHPDLVDWPDLPDSSREFVRYSCRRIPLLLADFDFEVFRKQSVGTGPA